MIQNMPGCATCSLSQGIVMGLFSFLAKITLRKTALDWMDFRLTEYVHSSVILRLNCMSKQRLHTDP